MSVEHMAMVFAAEGLGGSEKLLLLAYTNYTDPHGYCWPGEERLAEDTGTSVSTVRRTKKKLIQLNLVKSVRRAETSNLARVNLPLLASMARARTAYDDNEMARLSFDDPSESSPKGGSDLLTGQSDLYPPQAPDLRTVHSDLSQVSDCSVGQVNLTCGTGQSDLQSISDPSDESTTSPQPPVRLVSESAPTGGGGGGGDAPQQQEKNTAAAGFVDALPYAGRRPDRDRRERMIALAAAALAAGWSEPALRVQVTSETESAKSLAAVYEHRLTPAKLPVSPPPPKPSAVPSGGGDDRPKCSRCGSLIRKSADVADELCKECREGKNLPMPVQRGVPATDNSRGAALARGNMADKAVRPRV